MSAPLSTSPVTRALADAIALSNMPTVGTVYDVLNLGGLENVYTAVPGLDGAADTVTDTLVTPFGNVDLSSLFAGFNPSCQRWTRVLRVSRSVPTWRPRPLPTRPR